MHGNDFDSCCTMLDSEQEALLKIKEGFIKSSDPFSSWTAEKDCCKWRVGCDNRNGHVTILYLHSQDLFNLLQVKTSPSLFDLPYLKFQDLSLNILVLFNI